MENIRLSCPLQSNCTYIACNLIEPDRAKEFFQGILWNLMEQQTFRTSGHYCMYVFIATFMFAKVRNICFKTCLFCYFLQKYVITFQF